MSSEALLILSARPYPIARSDGHRRPAPSKSLSERSRVSAGDLPAALVPGGRRREQPLPRRGAAWFARSACAGTGALGARAALLVGAALLASVSPRAVWAQDAGAQPAAEQSTAPAEAADAGQPRTIGGTPTQGPCVIVDIAGHRAGHLDCATQRLEEAARIAQEQARAGIDAPVPRAGSPDVQLGVANQTATRLRMGNALGRSVHPERPASRPPRGPRP